MVNSSKVIRDGNENRCITATHNKIDTHIQESALHITNKKLKEAKSYCAEHTRRENHK